MIVLTWLLLAVGFLAVAVCAVHVHRHHGPTREVAAVLPLAALLPFPALLADDASARAWGLWGVTAIAAALTWAVADALRDIPATRPAGSRRAR